MEGWLVGLMGGRDYFPHLSHILLRRQRPLSIIPVPLFIERGGNEVKKAGLHSSGRFTITAAAPPKAFSPLAVWAAQRCNLS